MMKTISEEARLSNIYTNHCVRATAITLWSNAGISNRHIMAISGHRSEQSLVSYNSRPSTSQLHNCSQVLSRAFSPSANNHSQLSEASRQSTSFQTKQVATKPIFSECTIQNVQIVFNGSSSESIWNSVHRVLNDFGRLSTFFPEFVHNSIELFYRLLDTDLRKKILIDISGNVIKLYRVAGVQSSVVMNEFSRACFLLSCKTTRTYLRCTSIKAVLLSQCFSVML